MNVGEQEIQRFREVLVGRMGLQFHDDKKKRLSEVLLTRMAANKCVSADGYLERVATRVEESVALARELTVSETYFFRDRPQFEAFRSILQRISKSPSRKLNMLSAGCSTGDEAYSLAICARQILEPIENWDVRISAIDLNEDVLRTARSGSYRSWALRDTSADLVSQYFDTDESNCFQLHASVREMVQFRCDNLAHPTGPLAAPGTVDVAFCRNVLMYFQPDVARRVIAHIATSLRPRGYLFLGHAENLRGLSQDFHLCHTHGTFYYRRHDELSSNVSVVRGSAPPQVREPLPVEPDKSWFEAVARSSERIESLSRAVARRLDPESSRSVDAKARTSLGASELSHALDLMRRERFHDALQALAPLCPNESHPEESLLRAMLLVSTGQLEEAQRLCGELLERDELNAGAHYVCSICDESQGNLRSSFEHSRTACYLDAGFAMPHLQLGRLARRNHDYAMARRELETAIELLAREDASRILLFGGGFSRDTLVRVCRAELEACGDQA